MLYAFCSSCGAGQRTGLPLSCTWAPGIKVCDKNRQSRLIIVPFGSYAVPYATRLRASAVYAPIRNMNCSCSEGLFSFRGISDCFLRVASRFRASDFHVSILNKYEAPFSFRDISRCLLCSATRFWCSDFYVSIRNMNESFFRRKQISSSYRQYYRTYEQ